MCGEIWWWVSRRAAPENFGPFTLFLVKSRRVAPGKFWGKILASVKFCNLGQTRAVRARMAEVEVAVVTGAARGLGFAIATALAQRGARVCLLDLSRQALDTAAQRLAAAVPAAQIMVHAVDVADANGVATAVATVSRRWGRVDTLVQAAGAPSSTVPTRWLTEASLRPPTHTPSCALHRHHGQDEHQDGGSRPGGLR
jgi:hypothetical protein